MDPIPVQLALVPLLVFWIWMFWNMVRNDGIATTAKAYWALAFALFNVFAAVYYYATEYRSRV